MTSSPGKHILNDSMATFIRVQWLIFLILEGLIGSVQIASADSVNSPNITLNVDTNRSTGAGAGNVSVAVNTITIAETQLPEYTSGASKKITLQARPGYQFDTTSNITAQSATIGINNGAVNTVASVTPSGSASETITFNLTSGTNSGLQDIIRINGVRLKILSAEGAAGPAQVTVALTTSTAGGAFTNQGIVAANINKGAPDHMTFSVQPSTTQAGTNLVPVVKVVDFGGNLITGGAGDRIITLSIQNNPGSATLGGLEFHTASGGIASWLDADGLKINTAATGYTLRAVHNGASFLTSDTVDSSAFDITSGAPGHLTISTQPLSGGAGDNILIAVTAFDNLNNPVTGTSVPITLDLTTNPTDTSLLVDSSLTKNTDSTTGIATWDITDKLRIADKGDNYKISASGVGDPVESNAFNVSAGASSSVRYLQQPTDTTKNTAISPTVIAEVVDAFGNRTNFSSALNLTLSQNPCNATISGGSATASDGVAIFPSVKINKLCIGYALKGAGQGLTWAESDLFSVIEANSTKFMGLKLVELNPGAKAHVTGSGKIPLPNLSKADPTKKGAKLVIKGDSGAVTFSLGAKGWKRKDGGFQFKSATCSSVTFRKNKFDAVCKLVNGSFALPDQGPVGVTLLIGNGTQARYCGQCGGTEDGNQSLVYKHRNCRAPTSCR